MRQAGTLDSERNARRICDYLLTQGIGTQIEADAGEWILWVYDEDELDLVLRELAAFRKDPDHKKYENRETEANQIRQRVVQEEKQARRNFVDVRQRWATGLSWRTVPFTTGILAASTLVFLVCYVGGQMEFAYEWLTIAAIEVRPNGIVAWERGLAELRQGQVWRVFTPALIHFGWMHVIFNSIWMWQLGGAIEFRRGRRTIIPLVVGTAIISNLVQYIATGYPVFGGLSGVVYGVFGYVWMKSRFDPRAGLHIPQSTVLILLGWLVLCFTPLIPNVANGAHLAGLVVGVAYGYAPILLKR